MYQRFAIGLIAIAACLHGSAAEPKLNVIVILADDLGARDLACYGSKYHRTPNLDRLAATGVLFTDGYAACPVCSPTRAALLTGRYPARINLTDWLPGRPDRSDQKLLRPQFHAQLPLEETTIAEALKASGYATAHIGKWHLGGDGYGPVQQGFDVNIAGDHTGTPKSYFAPFVDKQGLPMPGLEDAPAGAYLPDVLTSKAESFIADHRDRPFFLYMAHYSVHTPLKAKPEVIAKYPADRKSGEQNNPIYAAMVESLDDSVGRILAKLDEVSIADRTAVIFTSDNGGLCVIEGPNTPATINAPLREGKGYLYEGGIRAPFLVRWPGKTAAGLRCPTPVSTIDLLPTILEGCGVAIPNGIDGVSLAPTLQETTPIGRDALYWHYPHYSNQGGKPGAAIRVGNNKLIEFYEDGRKELFELGPDGREGKNIFDEKPNLAQDLSSRLGAWREKVNASKMAPNPNYLPNPPGKDGSILLTARAATVHGSQLRYEPLPHKETLGFWTRAEDWASWEFTVQNPGRFTVEVLQGCGTGQGGSEVEIVVGAQRLPMIVEDTGHFQNFRPRTIGVLEFDQPGRHSLEIRPKTKAKAAVMDVRAVSLRPVVQ